MMVKMCRNLILIFAVTFMGIGSSCVSSTSVRKLNTYTVRAKSDDLDSVVTATAQLAPVYTPGGRSFKAGSNTNDGPAAGVRQISKPSSYITKTVYGFLDFVTTVGNTVMVFTPQSQTINEKPSTSKIETTSVRHRFAQSSEKIISPSSSLSIENLFTVPPSEGVKKKAFKIKRPIVRKSQNEVKEIEETNDTPTSRPGGFRLKSNRPQRKRTNNLRPDVIYFNGRTRQKPTPSKVKGGSTIVPIIVEGTGKVPVQPSVILESSFGTPSEVTIRASQGFASLSVVNPYESVAENNLYDDYEYSESNSDYEVEPTALIEDMIESNSEMPTGLVTTLGGTIISDRLTTVHQTSVIGTYISGKYAQILQSTSRIFQYTPVLNDNLNSPSVSFETVQSIIEGSATQFITPNGATALPLESLFSASENQGRSARLDESKISKRRGPEFNRPEIHSDPFLDAEHDHDLQRSGTELRSSFKQLAGGRRRYQSVEPTTYRPHINFTPRYPLRENTYRPDSFVHERTTNRWRLPTSEKPKLKMLPGIFKNFKAKNNEESQNEEELQSPDYIDNTPVKDEETTIRVETNYIDDASETWYETATVKSIHLFKVGPTKNTRFVTFTRTFTHSIEPTGALGAVSTLDDPLFENILDEPKQIATLPPIDISEHDITALLSTVTDTFSTTETTLKTSILPVISSGETVHHTLTQTYLITRVVTAVKTVPPIEAFNFIPENSLNEFNTQLLAEGTENEESLHQGELEYEENGEVRVKPPPGFQLPDPDLAQLAAGKLNAEALDQKMRPDLVAAIQTRNQAPVPAPQLLGTQPNFAPAAPAYPTPSLSPEQLQQLAYIRLMNPYAAAAFGSFPQFGAQQPHVTITSSPVVFTTKVTVTSTRLLRVIFNARPITTTVTDTDIKTTVTTTYNVATVTVPPIQGFGGFPFPQVPFPSG